MYTHYFQDWHDHPQHKKLIDPTSVRLDLSMLGIMDFFLQPVKFEESEKIIGPSKKEGFESV